VTIGRVDLFVLRRLAMCRFGLAVVFSLFWILVVLIRMQTSFAVVVSSFMINGKQRGRTPVVLVPRNIIAVVTRCPDRKCHHKFGAVVKLFNYLKVEALVNIRSL